MRSLPYPPLLIITDRRQAAPRSLEWVVAAALDGGARWVSVREKDLNPDARLALLCRLKPITQAVGAVLMVHDDLAAATRLDLPGLHLPATGDATGARAALPSGLIGQSWHGDATSPLLADLALDYLTLSPIFLTRSKPGYGPALGLAGLRQAHALSAKPILALGGIGIDELDDCIGAGAAGIAVMGEVMRAADPARLCADLLARLDGHLSAR